MKKLAGYLLVAIHALILLFLLFHDRIVFPPWIQSFGRIHPLFLHIPIGVLVTALLLVFFLRRLASQELVNLLLAFIALTAALTALMGIVLGSEEGYEPDLLDNHRLAGLITSVLAWATYFVHSVFPDRKIAFRSLLAITLVVLLVAGHLGSVITHGDRFVLAPVLGSNNDKSPVNDSTSLFRAAIYPVLETKCISCHNDNKRKGKFSMESMTSLLKGGENGAPWQRGEPGKSIMISRLLLPEDHKEHMPPAGKQQLTLTEVNLLYQWVLSGADTTLAWTSYLESDTVRKLADRMIRASHADAGPRYDFEAADEETVASLNDPYRTVRPISRGEPALAVAFYIREEFDADRLNDLQPVREQLVEINLDGMPVTDDDCATLSRFTNLERLNLNFTSVGPGCLKSLASLPHLNSLALAGTALDDAALVQLRDFPSLKKVYLWNTRLSDVTALRQQLPDVAIDIGDASADNAILRLSPPMLSTDEFIVGETDSVTLMHKLPSVVIRYTLDGSRPDSTSSPVFKKPLQLEACTEVTAIACKPGWFCSAPARFLFFRSGATPTDVVLNTKPDKDYRGIGPRTIVDNKKGFADNYRGDGAWLGYRDQPFDAGFSFKDVPEVNEIVISYARNMPSFLFPPASVEVWGADDKGKMNLVRKVEIPMPTEAGPTQLAAIRIPLDHARYARYQIIARPHPQLPKWHYAAKSKETKDKRTWVFVDEVFFN